MNTAELVRALEITMHRKMQTILNNPIRPYIENIGDLGRHNILMGPRGTGKTTLMFQEAQKRKILYFSADDIRIPPDGVYDIVEEAFGIGYEGVFIDEVHNAADWDRLLKTLYDNYIDKMIWASDSSSLRIRSGIGETARRYLNREIPLMSFREYLEMKTGVRYKNVEDPFTYTPDFSVDSMFLSHFESYKREGFLPLFVTGNYDMRLLDCVEKIIGMDIPFFIPELNGKHIKLMRDVLRFLSTSNIPRIKTSGLTSQWGISYDKLIQLLYVMESTGLISIVPAEGDPNERFSKSKVFLTNPSLYFLLGSNEGNFREALTVLSFTSAGMEIRSSAKEEDGDFTVTTKAGDKVLLEVGGKSKAFKASDFVIRDKIDYPAPHVIPLWVLAMMW